jgi:hypothetical protein
MYVTSISYFVPHKDLIGALKEIGLVFGVKFGNMCWLRAGGRDNNVVMKEMGRKKRRSVTVKNGTRDPGS